ncbi:reverse transcriptase domain-containing protein [Tanacetum coccineum]|uniref:Reverse transcriptase domain-containing protein n=1 Tax=Tanacetum coccineum TaxID=301880 RepID=A0ABQ5EZJ3_9ASTR
MSSKAAGTSVDIESKQVSVDIESKQVMSTKALGNGHDMSVEIESKQDMSAKVPDTKVDLFLDQLRVDVTGTVVVMICRMWDVNAVTGRYLSTYFMVSDAKGNVIHYTTRKNVAHNFVRLKEGGIYLIKKFTVHPKKEEYRIRKNNTFMIEFDGATTIRKPFVKVVGFVHYPFQLVDFDGIEPTNNKYLIDKLYLSSSSSTMIFDDNEIPAVKALRNANRKNDSITFYCKVMIENVRTKKGWNFPSDGGDNFLRYRLELDFADDTAHIVVVMNDEPTTSLVGCSAESIMEEEDEPVEFLVLRYRLKLDFADDTTHFVVVMNDEPATSLVGCSAESIMEEEHESHTYYEYGTFESFTFWTIVWVEGVEESVCSSTLDAVAGTKSPKLKRLARCPSVLLLPNLQMKEQSRELTLRIQTVRTEIEDSDAEVSCGSAHDGRKKKGGSHSDKKKRKRYLSDEE